MTTKGWKFFDKNLMCRGVQFAIGQEVSVEGKIKKDSNGIHFYEDPKDISKGFSIDWRVCEVEAFEVTTLRGESVCRRLKVVREMDTAEKVMLFPRRHKKTTVYDWLAASSSYNDTLTVIGCRGSPLALQNERTREVYLL